MVKKIAVWIIEHRHLVLIGLLLITLFMAFQIKKIDIRSELGDLLPQKHPYVKVHKEYVDLLGDPFKVYLMLEVEKGDIYNKETLSKIKRIDRGIHLIRGVNHNQVYSLASRKVHKVTLKPDGVYVEQIMPNVPETTTDMELFRNIVRESRSVSGIWVSPDEKHALFSCAFIPGRTTFDKLFADVQKLAASEADASHRIYTAGEPVLVGWVYTYQQEMYTLFAVTFLALCITLWMYFRNLVGTIVPVTLTIMGLVWGLGFCVLLGYNLEPLTLVIPLILMARAMSHSVQVTERYFELYHEHKDQKKALIETASCILPPGALGIFTDAAGIFLIGIAPIPIMQKLAMMAGLWAFSIILSGLVGTPVLLSYFKPPKNVASLVDTTRGKTMAMLGWIGRLGYGKTAVAITCVTALLFVVATWIAWKVNIGDVNPGSPVLWEDSEYNVAIKQINSNFPGTEELYVIFEENTKSTLGVFRPSSLEVIDMFQCYMEPYAARSMSVADLVSPIQKYLYGGHPRWEILPTTDKESRQMNFILKGNAAPEDFDLYFTRKETAGNVILWFKDHMGDTIREAIAGVKAFETENQELLKERGVKIRLASGNIGLLAAMNETVVGSQVLNFVLVMSVIIVSVLFTYRSFLAAIILLIPLNFTNVITLSIMYFSGIGLNINTLPIISVGVGVGIDYGIYLLSRLCEEYQKKNAYDVDVASTAVRTTGKAILFTASTMIIGIMIWYFFSSLRFQAEMGLLLAIIMFVNMLGALLILPALVYVIKPKFLAKSTVIVG